MTCRLILATLALASLSTSPAFAYSSGPNSCSAQSHGGSAIKSGEGGSRNGEVTPARTVYSHRHKVLRAAESLVRARA